MSESQENLLNLWNHNHLWSGVDAWYYRPNDMTVSLSDVSNSVGAAVSTQGCENSVARPANPPLPDWSPTSLLHDADKSSIWSTSELCSLDAKTPSLSDQTNQWSLISPLPATLDGTWDAPRDPFLLDLPTVNPVKPWRPNQVVTTSLDNCQSTSNCPIVVTDSTVSDLVSRENKPLPSCEAEDNCDRSVLPGASDESTKLVTLTTEQLCDHLINSLDGWGRRPINQSIPWDTSSLVKLTSDQPSRSGIVTPTPGGASNSMVPNTCRLSSTPSHYLEASLWNNESPNGTAIWEKTQYDGYSDHAGFWSPGVCVDSLDSTCNKLNISATPLMFANSAGPAPVGRTAITTAPQTSHRPHFRNWENDKLCLPNGGAPTPAIGRPLLGATRCISNQMDDGLSHWCNSEAPNHSTNGLDSVSNNPNSWINSQTQPAPSGVAAAMQWNANNTSVASNFIPSMSSLMITPDDEVRRHHSPLSSSGSTTQPNSDRLLVQPYSNTYRADLVRLLTSQGFKKEDAQSTLINCNMEPERALYELRERCKPNTHNSCNLMAQTTTIQPLQHQQQSCSASGNTVGQLPVTPAYPGTVANGNASVAFPTTGRGKQQPSPGNSQLLNLMQHPHVMRQQFMQEFRSAFALSLPNTLNTPVVSTTGNSLLGQPPPPLLNGISQSPGSQSNTNCNYNGNNGIGSLFNRSANVPPPPVTPLIANPSHNTAKRSPRQLLIISAIQELQKKHQSIQQQIHMYKNNPTMCAQPQYADVFAELQGQMQQIEAQMKAKQAQLNLVHSQDTVTCLRSQQALQSTAVPPIDSVFANGCNAPIQGQRSPLDQLVHLLNEQRLRNNNTSNHDQSDSDFPAIGMWTPHSKSGIDSQDKMSDHSGGPRSLIGSRGSSGNIKSQQQQSPGWQSFGGSWSNTNGSNSQSIQHQRHYPPHHWAQSSNSGGSNQFNPHQLNGGGSVMGASTNGNQQSMAISNFGVIGNTITSSTIPNHQQKTNQSFSNTTSDQSIGGGGGQWVLIKPLPGHSAPKLSALHNLLVAQYGLIHFHVISQNNACILVRLQSTDNAFQLMRGLNAHLSIELLQESEVIAHMQRANSRGDFPPSVVHPSELNLSCGSAPTNWSSTTDPINNPAACFYSRKSGAQNNSRFGAIASNIY